jgi:hypothetical protein
MTAVTAWLTTLRRWPGAVRVTLIWLSLKGGQAGGILVW